MSAADFAAVVTEAGLRGDPAGLERRALQSAPDYARRVEEIAARRADRVRGTRSRLVEELRRVDPVAAARATTPWPRTLALLGAALSAAAAFALYFSRADLDVEAVIPIAGTLVAVAAALYAAAALPLRREHPPAPSLVVGGWILAGLTGATTAAVVQLVGLGAEGGAWVAIAAASVLVIAAIAAAGQVIRARIPAEERDASDTRGEEHPERVREAVLAERTAGFDEVRASFADLPESERAALEAELGAAYSELERRGLAHTSGSVPGFVAVAEAIRFAALGERVYLDRDDVP